MKIILICLLVLQSNFTYTQSGFESSYNAVFNGRNVNLSYRKSIGNLSISGGMKYHINRIEMIPIGSFFKNTAYAQNFQERIGLQVGLDYFLVNKPNFKLGAYYNNQFSFISLMHKMYYASGQIVDNPQSESDYLYVKSERIFGPVFESENTIGIVIESKLTSNFYSVLRGGFGVMFWKNTDSGVILSSNPNQIGSSFISFGSIGLGYYFFKK